MIPKLIESGFHFPKTNEPTVQLITSCRSKKSLIKTANLHSHHVPEIEQYLNSIKAEDGKLYALILALGASDYYGCNRNGDWFDEEELKPSHTTFESLPAHLFRHHQNKDPNNSYGEVVKSFYNPLMHRVEIIVKVDLGKAPDVSKKIEDGIPIATSMGCKVDYDECSICNNRAKTRAEYCPHARDLMRHVYEDGRQVFVRNKNPKFFDISMVFKPADRTSYVLKKVAYDLDTEREYSAPSALLGEVDEKLSSLRKLSDIIKIIRGITSKVKDKSGEYEVIKKYTKSNLPKLASTYRPIRLSILDKLAEFPTVDVMNMLNKHGIDLSTPELATLLTAKHNSIKPSEVPPSVGRVDTMMMPSILDSMAERPEIVQELLDSPEFYSDPEAKQRIAKIIEEIPSNRRFDDNSLVDKVAQYNVIPSDFASMNRRTVLSRRTLSNRFSDVARATKALMDVNGPGLQETVAFELGDGRTIILSREEMLKAILTSSRGGRELAVGIPAALTGLFLASGFTGAANTSYDRHPFSSSIYPLPVLGKTIGKVASINLPGFLTKLAFDDRLIGGNTIKFDAPLLQISKLGNFYDKLDLAIKHYKNYIDI